MKLKRLFLVLLAFIVLVFASCDKKTPEKGYISEERVNQIVSAFSSTTDYTSYTVIGSLNYLDKPEDIIPRSVDDYFKFRDSLDMYSSSASRSYYLRLPMHLTPQNWNYYDEELETYSDSTKARIQSVLLTVGKTLDELYFYEDAEGNLIIKTFGANKALKIYENDIVCHAKWNVTIVYNKEGYLVSEKFETINSHKDADSESCYGEAKYEFA